MLAAASLHPGQHWLVLTLVSFGSMMGHIMMLVCASLTAGEVEHLFKFICTFSSETCLLQLQAYGFAYGLPFFTRETVLGCYVWN